MFLAVLALQNKAAASPDHPCPQFLHIQNNISGELSAPVRIWDQKIPLGEYLEHVLDVLVVFEKVQNGKDEIKRKNVG